MPTTLQPVQIYTPLQSQKMFLPYFSCRVPAGFPSPADDSLESPLDIVELMIEHPNSTFYVRVEGESMTGAGIFPGDILVVDRSKTPKKDDVILAIIDNEFTVKRFTKKGSEYYLMPDNENYQPIKITKESGFEVWGVVTYVVHKPNA